MKRVSILTVAAAGALLSAASASAHHSFAAEFDRNLPVTVTGTVTKVEWMNPHARFYIDAKDDAGKTVNWDFELASPNGLMRRGWNRNSMKIGDTVTVDGPPRQEQPARRQREHGDARRRQEAVRGLLDRKRGPRVRSAQPPAISRALST